MSLTSRRALWPLAAGIAGTVFLAGLYLAIVSWAESPEHALKQFWGDRWIVTPILLAFGLQSALYVILRWQLYVPVTGRGPSGPLVGAGGGTSTVAMVACCLHHVADVLPILGVSAAATLLARYRIPFMLVGLSTSLAGSAVMLAILLRARRRVLQALAAPADAA